MFVFRTFVFANNLGIFCSWTVQCSEGCFIGSIVQIKLIGLGSSLYYYKRPRMSACDGKFCINQNAFEQADWVGCIFSVASLSKNCKVVQKTIVTKFPHLTIFSVFTNTCVTVIRELDVKERPFVFDYTSFFSFLTKGSKGRPIRYFKKTRFRAFVR